ncbi:ABC transporter substrate-binding protein [Marivirga sp. S37H4]|uniref:ABC transporter substrate-binding protein n=1 Tax=Marivirga aurantiaca TaxID=2802615 RepID=A0A934WWD6_9BACT|nr:substrate-binding domain-containing protein [Marivirga aurantiaca]MBK6264308.1 ABC transporter substrate-binding protein [Marivirga aurantiaca]
MKVIRIGGVPEHFNLPIHLALESGAFEEVGIKVIWNNYEGGTGEMAEALQNGDCDICALLTEGIVSNILKGNPSKIVSGYVKSPLTWGIHSGINNPLNNHADIYDKRIAISRYGSGSHLMPIVDALLKDKKIDNAQFKVINNLKGAIQSLNAMETDVFYWEKYTTKPLVQQNLLKKIGEYVTPWPCFVLAASEKIINSQPKQVSKVLRVIHKSCAQFMENDEAVEMVSKRYGIMKEDAIKWYHGTEWATDGWVSNKMLKNVIYTLREANIISENVDTNQLIWQRNSI